MIGVNGLAGNLGIAVAALSTGLLVKWLGWRAAFAMPGLLAIACGIAVRARCPDETRSAGASAQQQGAGDAGAGAAGARLSR